MLCAAEKRGLRRLTANMENSRDDFQSTESTQQREGSPESAVVIPCDANDDEIRLG